MKSEASQHQALISGPEAPPQWQWTWKQRGIRVCNRRILRINESMNKVIKCIRIINDKRMDAMMNGELLEEVSRVACYCECRNKCRSEV